MHVKGYDGHDAQGDCSLHVKITAPHQFPDRGVAAFKVILLSNVYTSTAQVIPQESMHWKFNP